jgi:hypothetical protein
VLVKAGASRLVESDGGKLKVRLPRTRAGSRSNGVPAAHVAPEVVPSSEERRANGQFAPGASTLQSKGGKLARRRDILLKRLNLPDLTVDDRKRAGELQKALLKDYTRLSGGELLTDVALLVESAVLRCVASRIAFAAGDATLGSRLADGSRSDILACRALCGNDSESRKRGGGGLPALDAQAEADVERQFQSLTAAYDKSIREGDEPKHMVTGTDEVTEPLAEVTHEVTRNNSKQFEQETDE